MGSLGGCGAIANSILDLPSTFHYPADYIKVEDNKSFLLIRLSKEFQHTSLSVLRGNNLSRNPWGSNLALFILRTS